MILVSLTDNQNDVHRHTIVRNLLDANQAISISNGFQSDFLLHGTTAVHDCCCLFHCSLAGNGQQFCQSNHLFVYEQKLSGKKFLIFFQTLLYFAFFVTLLTKDMITKILIVIL